MNETEGNRAKQARSETYPDLHRRTVALSCASLAVALGLGCGSGGHGTQEEDRSSDGGASNKTHHDSGTIGAGDTGRPEDATLGDGSPGAPFCTPTISPSSATCAAASQSGTSLVCLGCGSSIASFSTAVTAAGLTLDTESLGASVSGARVIVVEANNTTLAQGQALATQLEPLVKAGTSLLLAVDKPAGLAPFALESILPTTLYRANNGPQMGWDNNGPDGPIDADLTSYDAELFGTSLNGLALSLPFHIRMRPVDAAESGQWRYEQYAINPTPYLNQSLPAGNTFWSRPLDNHNWTVRVRGQGVEAIPLLITGTYGAGRVAVFGSSLAVTSPAAGPMWTGVLNWLAGAARCASEPSGLTVTAIQGDVASHALVVSLKNASSVDFSGSVIVRGRTWERAPIADFEAGASVAAGATSQVTVCLPSIDDSSLEALAFRDAYDVRAGVLSADGTLLDEQEAKVDLSDPVALTVHTDDIRTRPVPTTFDSTNADSLSGDLQGLIQFPSRMGFRIDEYAYAPGDVIHGTVTIANGLANLAPLATVADVTSTTPNASAVALNDLAANTGTPDDGVSSYGAWTGIASGSNTLTFSFPETVTISSITLVGSAPTTLAAATTGGWNSSSGDSDPSAVTVTLDDHAFGCASSLTWSLGRATIACNPTAGQTLTLVVSGSTVSGRAAAPVLAEVEVAGFVQSTGSAPLSGALSVNLVDALEGTAVAATLGSSTLSVPAGTSQDESFTVTLPSDTAPHAYRLEARVGTRVKSAPVMSIAPTHALLPIDRFRTSADPSLGFIVTRGFRNAFVLGTGVVNDPNSWEAPDDLVFAYSHNLKQIGSSSRTEANRLYVTESDLAHYSTPYRTFPDDEYFYDVAAPNFLATMQRDNSSTWQNGPGVQTVFFDQSDRWDSGPTVSVLFGWQDILDFDAYLKANASLGVPEGLTGALAAATPPTPATREALSSLMNGTYSSQMQTWQLGLFTNKVIGDLQTTFGSSHKVIISSQGTVLVPSGADQTKISAILQGQSDDCSWGSTEESTPATTGRQMGQMAYDTSMQMSTIIQWGYTSSLLNNPQWHEPVGTTEPSRRMIYDRAFRGLMTGSTYHSMHAYAFGSNAGVAASMTENDWQEWWRMAERHVEIAPDGPLGLGIVISTSSSAYSGSSGNGSGPADVLVQTLYTLVRTLHEAGISVAFSTNAADLAQWTSGGPPLLLIDACTFRDDEIGSVSTAASQGSKVVGFPGPSGCTPSAAATALIGGSSNVLTGAAIEFTGQNALAAAAGLQAALSLPIHYAPGTSGYGFTSQGLSCVVVEDWMEQGRTVPVELAATPGMTHAAAVDLNEHRSFTPTLANGFWSVSLPMRPADGNVLCFKESP